MVCLLSSTLICYQDTKQWFACVFIWLLPKHEELKSEKTNLNILILQLTSATPNLINWSLHPIWKHQFSLIFLLLSLFPRTYPLHISQQISSWFDKGQEQSIVPCFQLLSAVGTDAVEYQVDWHGRRVKGDWQTEATSWNFLSCSIIHPVRSVQSSAKSLGMFFLLISVSPLKDFLYCLIWTLMRVLHYCIFMFFVLSIFARTLCCPNSGRLAVRHQSYMKQKLQSHRNQLSFETPDSSSTVQRGHQCTSLGQEQNCFQEIRILSCSYFQQENCFQQVCLFFVI